MTKYLIILALLLAGCIETELEIDILWEDENGNFTSCEDAMVEGMRYAIYDEEGYIEAKSSGIIPCQNIITRKVFPDADYTINITGYYTDSYGLALGWEAYCTNLWISDSTNMYYTCRVYSTYYNGYYYDDYYYQDEYTYYNDNYYYK